MLHIKGKLEGIDELTAKFKSMPEVIEKATVSALNKLGTRGLKAAKDGVFQVYNIPREDVEKAMARIPAKRSFGGKGSRLWTTITAKGARIPLMKFEGRPESPFKQKGIAVRQRPLPTVRILRQGSARYVTPDQTGHGAFVARMGSGFGGSTTNHIGIFVRTNKWLAGNRWRGGKAGSKHQVIRELKSKGVAESFASKGRQQLDKIIAEQGKDIMASSLQQFFDKAMKNQALPSD